MPPTITARRARSLTSTLALTVALTATGCGGAPSEREIRTAIEQARGCGQDTDCVNIGAKCPFGCAIAINRKDEGRIRSLVNSFAASCLYDCAPISRLFCGRADGGAAGGACIAVP